MARKAEPGISYYRMNCNHIHNKKVKLIFNEFGPSGYWVWQCILSSAYGTTGYYFDCNDRDSLELFALDVCKMRVAKVDEIIAGCLRRSLFDERVFKMFGVLTSEMMQEDYLIATNERRKKTSLIELKKDYLLIDVSPNEKNILILPGGSAIPTGRNQITPGSSTHSRVEKSREELKVVEEEKEISEKKIDEGHYSKLLNRLKSSMIKQQLIEKNKISENECFLLFRNFYEQKFDFDELQSKDDSDVLKNFFYWVPKHLIAVEKEKSSAKKEKAPFNQQQPVRGVAAAVKFADVKMWEDE